MIYELIDNNKNYCFTSYIYNYSDGGFELQVAKPVNHNYYAVYNSGNKRFIPDLDRVVKETDIYFKIIGVNVNTSFHKYTKNEKYRHGYYLVSYIINGRINVIKIVNNKTYIVELLKDENDSVIIYPIKLLESCYISDDAFYLVRSKSIEEI